MVLEVLVVTVQMVRRVMETRLVQEVAVTKLLESTPILVKKVTPANPATLAIPAIITFLD